MSSPTELKHRIKAVKDARKITGAMETVSIAKMSRAAQKCEQYDMYFDKLQDVISDISLRTGDWVHPCFNGKKVGKKVFFVISPSKGLVGGFNHGFMEFAREKISEAENPLICTLGKEAERYFKKKDIPVSKHFDSFEPFPKIDDAEKIAVYLYDLYLTDYVGEVYLIYASFSLKSNVCPKAVKLLPIGRGTTKERYLYEIYYEPTPEEVLEGLVPQYLTGMIYGCLLQSVAAEHFSRRMAMSSAKKNADELLRTLTTEYNTVRQNAVTNEISDMTTAKRGVNSERNDIE